MLKPPWPYRLRRMRLSDVDSVMAIEHTAFPVPWRASAYQYEITGNRLATYLVLTVNLGDSPAKLIGYAGFWLLADEVHISTLAVNQEWQHRGLGQLLLLAIMRQAYAEPVRLVTLEVRRSNTAAQALYQKYRFQLVGERPRYYQRQEDALIMTVEPLDETYRAFLRQTQSTLFRCLEAHAHPIIQPDN
jgi:ribosomal-protein-alanine N-acetyltransferase